MREEYSERKNVLITGATGGLGLTLAEVFADAGYKVRASGRNNAVAERLRSYGAEFIKSDLTDADILAKLCCDQDVVIHAAALSNSWGDPEIFQKVNVVATKNILIAAQNSGVGKFIFISSPSIYAAMKDQINLTEDDNPSNLPLNDYARTKLEAEKAVILSNTPKFITVVLRPRAIVGSDDKVLLPKIMQMIERGMLPVLRGGRALIELTDVRDVAHAVLLAERNIDKVAAEAVNISGGRPIPIKQLAEKIAAIMNRPVRYVPVPMVIAQILAILGEKIGQRNYGKEPGITRYTLATMAYSQTFDMAKAKEKLGYIPAFDAFETILQVAKERAK